MGVRVALRVLPVVLVLGHNVGRLDHLRARVRRRPHLHRLLLLHAAPALPFNRQSFLDIRRNWPSSIVLRHVRRVLREPLVRKVPPWHRFDFWDVLLLASCDRVVQIRGRELARGSVAHLRVRRVLEGPVRALRRDPLLVRAQASLLDGARKLRLVVSRGVSAMSALDGRLAAHRNVGERRR